MGEFAPGVLSRIEGCMSSLCAVFGISGGVAGMVPCMHTFEVVVLKRLSSNGM